MYARVCMCMCVRARMPLCVGYSVVHIDEDTMEYTNTRMQRHKDQWGALTYDDIMILDDSLSEFLHLNIVTHQNSCSNRLKLSE